MARWAETLITTVLALVALGPASSEELPATAKGAAKVKESPREHDGARDFDFWMGHWKIHNRRLADRRKSLTEWEEFEATGVTRPLLGGLGNEDEYHTDHWNNYFGMSFRFFNPATKQWAIYWADNQTGVLQPPLYGSFSGATGTFESKEIVDGRPVRVRYIWSRVDTATPRWEQAFSTDDGKTWETNWVMDMTRGGDK